MKKVYVIDTNVFLSYPESLRELSVVNDVVIPFKVIEEIDNNKHRPGSVGINARSTMRLLDELRSYGNLSKGINFPENKGKIVVELFNSFNLPRGMDEETPDNQILSSALEVKKRFFSKKVVLLTNDINMRVKCDSVEVDSEAYNPLEERRDLSELYDGFKLILVDDITIDRFYKGEQVFVPAEEEVFPNQFITLQSIENDKKTALTRFISAGKPLVPLCVSKSSNFWGLLPRNKEQIFALELILDRTIDLVTLTGPAGTGKSLCALGGALAAAFERKEYKKILILRPIVTVGKDIGYLPGTKQEKMEPYTAPIVDNLNFLFNDDNNTLDMYIEKRIIEVEAVPFIRGRSLANSIMIVDEAQNMSPLEAKTIITRAGEGTKVILTGDQTQIDTIHLNETTNGLTQTIEQFKYHNIAGHVTMKKGERSALATLAAKIMK